MQHLRLLCLESAFCQLERISCIEREKSVRAGEPVNVKIVVVSPHRDDAAFALTLAVDAWIAAGHKVSVVNCFSRSDQAPYSDADSIHANDRMSFVTALRGREDESWRRQYGTAVTLVDLNMKDAPLRLHIRADEVFGLSVNVNDKALVKIQKAVERIGPAAVVLPLGLSGHIDHLTARQSMLTVAAGTMACAFYEDVPFTPTPEPMEKFVGGLAREFSLDLKPVLVGRADDETAAIARRRRAAFCYDSQVDDAEVEAIAQFCKVYGGRERLWANPAWLALSLTPEA